jgi:alpha-ribazole phosphatase
MPKEIYLIRHTTPAIAKGICYGKTDLDLTESLEEEAAVISRYLPAGMVSVHSSPLQRCRRLAAHLFPAHELHLHNELMEIDCGSWEMRAWDELRPEELDPWMNDFVQVRIPGGESYLDLNERVNRVWGAITGGLGAGDPGPVALVTHGGPIRSILASLTGTPLSESFSAFSLHYGCVIRVVENEGGWAYEILSNPAPREKEQHKPSRFKRG